MLPTAFDDNPLADACTACRRNTLTDMASYSAYHTNWSRLNICTCSGFEYRHCWSSHRRAEV